MVTTSKDDIRKKIFEAELQEIIELGKKPQEEWISKEAKKETEERKKEEELNEQIAELRDDAVSQLEHTPVYSLEERMTTIEQKEDGSVILPLLIKDNNPVTFKTKEEYEKWLHERQEEISIRTKEKLTPHEFYITQGKYTERAFTGQYWWVKDVGIYSCKVWTQKLFMSEHKYELHNGYSNFWSHVLDSVAYRGDYLERHLTQSNQAFVEKKFKEKLPEVRAVWSNWESHLGFVYNDGPGPFHKRFTVNSASVNFTPKPWFEEPMFTFEERMILKKFDSEKKYIEEEKQKLKKHEEIFGFKPDMEFNTERHERYVHKI